ncbi:pentatricopeptide repeat-containing protein At5g06540-like [Rutidosis leptorrhynchoides]|uniref:pentatricopeptide repeat-containing protein At5g06540-like n=1 Tax=Rutidosis leptorrhynchoides TaxID=125765 RepID=UPI003A9A50A8
MHISSFGSLNYASLVSLVTDNTNLFTYSASIRAYSSNLSNTVGKPHSLAVYKQILLNYIVPDCISIPFILKGRVNVDQSDDALSVNFGVVDDVYVRNLMIGIYTGFGVLTCSQKVFDEMFESVIVS